MYTLSNLVLLLSICTFIETASVLQTRVYVMETGAFLQYMTDIEDLQTCEARFLKQDQIITFSLDINLANVKPEYFEDDNNLSDRIFSLGYNLCGFKLTNSSLEDPEIWTLQATDSENNQTEVSFEIIQYPYDPSAMYKSMVVTLGESVSITCGHDVTQNQDFCKLYNPSGKLIETTTRCEYYTLITMSDIGTWYCVTGTTQNMETLTFVVELEVRDQPAIIGWITEDENYYSIGCQNMYENSPIPSFCTMTSPSGSEYIIRNGRATARYNTLKTNLTNSSCAIEIPKPLQSDELGLWRCKIGNRGKILNVGNIAVPDYQRSYAVDVTLGSSFEINCVVPYSASYCHIQAPNGERYFPNFMTIVELGQCSHVVAASADIHVGTWTCFFAKESETIMDEIQVEVQITSLLVFSEEVTTNRDESVELLCKTGGDPGAPIKYCWFLSPNDVRYYMHENLNTEEVAYIGAGLNYGDCSMRINRIKNEDFGNWTCIAIIRDTYEITGIILISESSFISGSTLAIWITLGVVSLLAVLAILFAIIHNLRKRRNNAEAETVAVSRTSRGTCPRDSLTTTRPTVSTTEESMGVRQRR